MIPAGSQPRNFATPDGVLIAGWCTGTGRPLLAVHGTGEDHRRWGVVARRLGHLGTVWAIDRRGRGHSTDASPYSLVAEAHDITAVVACLGPDVIVIGHSYGALCALEAALLGAHTAGLVLFEPPIDGEAPPESMAEIRRLIDVGVSEQALAVFLTDVAGMPMDEAHALCAPTDPATRGTLTHTLLREITASGTYRPDASRLSRLDVPVLLLHGTESPAWLRWTVRELGATLPGSRIESLPGHGHHAMDRAPRAYLSPVVDFVRTLRWETAP